MKRRNVILSVLLVIATIAAAIVISNARTSYEITDGAVVFNSNNTVSYLANGGSVHNLNISYDSANNAACLVVSGNGEDPYALLNYNTAGVTSLSANTYKYIVVTEKVPTGASSSATTTEIFYCAGSINVPTGGKSELFNFTKDGTYHSYIIDMSGVSGWTGTIHSLRVDPFTTASVGDTLYLDSVILAKTSAEASTIAAYRTAKANGTVNDSQSQVIFTSSNYNTYLSADEAEGSLNGDVNADGVVNSNDVRDLKRFCVCYSVANFDEEAADVNSDGIISIKDILCLKKGLVGLYDLGNSAGAASCSVAFDATAEKALLTATNSEPYANFSYPAGDEAIYASQFRYAVITYSASKSGTASVLGATSKTPVESAESHTFAVNGDGDFHSVIVDFSGDSGWTGSIGNLKIRFFNSASTGDWMMLDSITFVEKTSDASSIANTREAVANGATFSEYYTLDIKGQTLGQINAAGTYQNIGYSNNNVLYPFSASWPAAGYANGAQDTLVVFANYDNYIKVADCVDLSKYDRVTITYGTDHRFTTTASEFGFFSAPTIYGQQGSKNTANRLLYVPLTPATAQADWTPQRSSSANINSNYVGPLYMSYYMATSDGAVVTDIEFHLRNAEAATVDTLNNSSGSTVYTVSGDGTTITANGVTYPNKLNYTNGVTVGTDDVNRTLRTDKAAATNGGVQGYDFTNKNVGIFYFLWLGEHGTNLYDIQARINNGVPNLTNPTGNDPAWGPLGVHQHFSEPLYGYYFSSDEWVIRRHIEELTNADIDFLFFDVTNGPAYLQNAFKVMQVIHEFNEMGYKPPKVVFYSNNTNSTYTPGSTILNYIWQNVYSQNLYPDTWFYYQGKPVIVGKKAEFQQLSSSVQNFFTFRQSQWPNETTTSDGNAYSVTYKNHKNNYTIYKKNGGWSWMD
ncbi:MAG: dockerin type I repeat-containing protein, partial [Clostridia bacterium]|nr:dockerin type I repeat-containing protein [Clostridia bacterium]